MSKPVVQRGARSRGRLSLSQQQREEEALRLESRPSPVLSWVLAGSLSALAATAAVAVATVQVDQIVSIPGKLVTRRSTQELGTPSAGVIQQVLVRNGDRVEAGQPLLILDPQVQRSDVTELRLQLEAETSRLDSEADRLRERIYGLERQLVIDEEVLAPLKQLAGAGAAANLQVRQQERVLEGTRRELEEAREALESVRFESDRSRARLRQELAQAESSLELVTLRAPVSGVVIDLRAQSGQVAFPTSPEPLLQLVPDDDLQAQAFAPNQDLAFIRAGQEAEIALSAYDSSLYGRLPATVALVSQDALPPDEIYQYPHFPITLELEQQVLERNGQTFELQPGMALTAQIKLQKRTLLQLFFSRFNQGLDAVRTMR
ncbi:HlyD family efflux transporter periplasmic adaptor subunit [Synechococcus sp. RSCCF101]|uniref:HlyD family efflux transporter periplasmic adaptor subunit n=1 Tax=Synechococcus sp. RSCCF101 TaxID=2511069 RepID=UPI001243D57B|nr:HlyD family efflux transporter periplasmic adaptor subunit [Synechococcus sp. RSCCF101]QEY32411.1 HlyD family efflux transporter periplasmic adaptor subunit [Synechococcus sp. RSCCF101]